MKRIAGALLLIVGILVGGYALYQIFAQEEETVVEVSAPAEDVPFVYTAPGVLALVDDSVEVTLSASGETITWGVGTVSDVEAYIGEAGATRIAGLDSWDALNVETAEGTAEANELIANAAADGGFNLYGSDLWTERGNEEDEVTISLDPPSNVEYSLIASTTSGNAPEVTLAWDHTFETSNPIPVLAIGILATLIGLLLLLSDSQERAVRKQNDAKDKRDRERTVSRQGAETSVLPRYNGDLTAPGTDREIQRTYTDGALGASVLPGSMRADSLRQRDLQESDRLVLPEPATPTTPAVDDRDDEAAARKRSENSAASAAALGAMILPSTARAESFRSRELDPADRVVLPEALVASDEDASADDADVIADADVVAEAGVIADADNAAHTEADTHDDVQGPDEVSAPLSLAEPHDNGEVLEERDDSVVVDAAAEPEALAEPNEPEAPVQTDELDAPAELEPEVPAEPQSPAEADELTAERSEPAEEAKPHGGDEDWRSLWNFSWGTPWSKKEGDNA